VGVSKQDAAHDIKVG